MCGICGIYGDVSKARIREMSDCINHRGPDSEGFYVDKNCGIGIRRLAIIDTEGGQQPISNEEGNLQIVFNGEIYNYQILKNKLEKYGHEFSTESDTEVILHGYEEWGRKVLKKLNGMFAFALYNTENEKLFLARDRVGIKPLFYSNKEEFLFGSEIKSLIQDHSISQELDWEGINYYLYFKYFPDPYTPLKDIKSLPPGHFAEFHKGELTIQRYWDFEGSNDSKSLKQNAQNIKELLEDSVEKRLMGERNIGTYLSGGLDSTTITAMMDSLGNNRINTYSVGFSEDDKDMSYAREVSRKIGTNHTEFLVEKDSLDILPEIVKYMDMPVGDAAFIPTYLLSKKASESSTVILTGEGSDELFGGYPGYRFMNMLSKTTRRMPEFLRNTGARFSRFAPDRRIRRRGKEVIESLEDPEKTIFELKKVFSEEQIKQITGKATSEKEAVALMRENTRNQGEITDRMMDYETRVRLPADLLAKVDRMTMAYSMEARVPFLDHRIVEYAKSIPLDQKIGIRNEKIILKKAARDYVPQKIINRKKDGFTVPFSRWIREDQERIRNLFENSNTPLRYNLEKLLKNPKNPYNRRKIITLMMLEIWLQNTLADKN